MDSLSYKYNRDSDARLVNNKLNHVRDAIINSNYSIDIDNQASDNYTYDRIGNLIRDNAEGLDTIRWTVYGKINRIRKNNNSLISYGYDPFGNRTFKGYQSNDTITQTYYVRDADGNVMGIYQKNNSEGIKWEEQHLYGSSRLGIWKWGDLSPSVPPVVVNNTPVYDSLMYGVRKYELTNHLGNVLGTINDKKIGNDSSGVANYYTAEVLSQNDYYPFGMLMPGREFGILGRYGFNGKEIDSEVKETGSQYDYGFRVYDSRIGKFLSVDPLTKMYPELSSYQFASNNPIQGIDLDGREIENFMYGLKKENIWSFCFESKQS